MTYDARLADRVRELLVGEESVLEKKMFGGLAFLVAKSMAVAVSGRGGLLVRVDPVRAAHLLATTRARPLEMKGRLVKGWLHVDGDAVRTRRQLARWLAIGTHAAKACGHI